MRAVRGCLQNTTPLSKSETLQKRDRDTIHSPSSKSDWNETEIRVTLLNCENGCRHKVSRTTRRVSGVNSCVSRTVSRESPVRMQSWTWRHSRTRDARRRHLQAGRDRGPGDAHGRVHRGAGRGRGGTLHTRRRVGGGARTGGRDGRATAPNDS